MRERIEEVRRILLEQHAETEVQQEMVNTRLDQLAASLADARRDTWFYAAIGVVATISAALTLSPERGQAILRLLLSDLPRLLG